MCMICNKPRKRTGFNFSKIGQTDKGCRLSKNVGKRRSHSTDKMHRQS